MPTNGIAMIKIIKYAVILIGIAVVYFNISKLKKDYHSELDPVPLNLPCESRNNIMHTCTDRIYERLARVQNKCLPTAKNPTDIDCLIEYQKKEN